MAELKKTVYSGIQPSGEFTIGNYFGAIKNWTKLQDEYNCIFSIVDMHALTVAQEPAVLRRRTLECCMMLLAAGIDPKKSVLYVQSQVCTHAELSWILSCFSYMGELGRMTQYKDKSQKQGENIRVGLFAYPVLMAADILLYQADYVPIGDDQRQHLELSRDIAQRFNAQFSPTFTVPEGIYGTAGTRIMSLADPSKKMSKSDANTNAYILMRDSRDVIINKFKRAVSDSQTQIYYDETHKPGISNLLEIYACAADTTVSEAERQFSGKSYAEFKLAVGEAVADSLAPLQREFERITAAKEDVEKALTDGREKALAISNKTLSKVKRKIGYLQ